MTEKVFEFQGLSVKLSAEVLPAEQDVKSAIEGSWQLQNVKNSKEFLKGWNALQTQVRNKKLDFVEYAASLMELQKFEENNFASKGVANQRTFIYRFEGDNGLKHSAQITVDARIDRIEAVTLLEAYRLLGLGKNSFTVQVVNYFIKQEQGPQPPYSSVQELSVFLESIDLQKNSKLVQEMIGAGKDAIKKFKPTVDAAEVLQSDILKSLDGFAKGYERKSQDPAMSPSGSIVGDTEQDTRLVMYLQALQEEAWKLMLKGGKPSPLKKLKNVPPEEHSEKIYSVRSVEEAKRLANGLGKPIQYEVEKEVKGG